MVDFSLFAFEYRFETWSDFKNMSKYKFWCMLCFLFTIVLITITELQAGTETPQTESLNFSFENKVEGVAPDLLKTVEFYWTSRASGLLEEAYDREAPHTRYQMSLEKYISRHERARKLNGLVLLNVDQRADLAVLRIKGLLKKKKSNGLNEYVIHDRWVRLRGEWYHVVQDKLTNLY